MTFLSVEFLTLNICTLLFCDDVFVSILLVLNDEEKVYLIRLAPDEGGSARPTDALFTTSLGDVSLGGSIDKS